MSLREDMLSIGLNPDEYFTKLASTPKTSREQVVQEFLAQVKKTGKMLLAKHHPDRGGSNDKFIRVKSILDSINEESERYVANLRIKIAEDDEKKSERIFIEKL